MRHAVRFFLCAFLLSNSIYSQEQDTTVNISRFWNWKADQIPVILDETGQNTYYFNTYSPGFLSDLQVNSLYLDGSLTIPLGSYHIPKLLPFITQSDTGFNISQINYKQGDYAYKELGIATAIQSRKGGIYKLQGITRTRPRLEYNSNSDNIFQNYLFNYDNKILDSEVSASVMYHRENINLPLINSELKNRSIESFHTGINFRKDWKRFSIQLNPVFQLTESDRWGNKSTHLSLWNQVSGQIKLLKYIHFHAALISKFLITEYGDSLYALDYSHLSSTLGYRRDKGGLEIGLNQNESSSALIWNLWYQAGCLNISSSSLLQTYIRQSSITQLNKINYTQRKIKVDYKNDIINVILEVLQNRQDKGDILGVIGELQCTLNWFKLGIKGGHYFSQSTETSNLIQPVDYFGQASLLLSPNIWFWKNSRYRPFVLLESYYIHYSSVYGINPDGPSAVNEYIGSGDYTSGLLNGEIGFLLEQFKISYRWVNLAEAMVQNSIDAYPIHPFRQLEVVWQFWN